jgi:hypothetical protein
VSLAGTHTPTKKHAASDRIGKSGRPYVPIWAA